MASINSVQYTQRILHTVQLRIGPLLIFCEIMVRFGLVVVLGLVYDIILFNPYSADFFFIFFILTYHFDISFCLSISRKGSIYLFDLFQFFSNMWQNPKRPISGTPAARGPICI